MSAGAAIGLLLGGLGLSVLSSVVLATSLDRVGERLGFSEGLLGIVTAVGADAPEIASALAALAAGRRDLGVGVVLGSNVFNIAALLGLSAVIAGGVRIRPRGLLFEGGVGLVATAVAVGLVLGALSGGLALALLLVVLVPYVIVSALGPGRVKRALPPGRVSDFLYLAMSAEEQAARPPRRARRADRHDVLTVVPALAAVVLGSVAMVHGAQTLGTRWHIPEVIVGTLVLATMTGLPNVLAAVRLARARRGSAVVSEALNSNTANVLAGLCLPALVTGLGTASGLVRFEAWWLFALTALTLALTAWRGRLERAEGAAILVLYGVFTGVVLLA